MNHFASWSPLLSIGRQLLTGKGSFGSFPFSQQLFNIAGNMLKQKGGEFLKGKLEQALNTDSGGSIFSGFDPLFRSGQLPHSQGQPGTGPHFRLFNGNFNRQVQVNPERQLEQSLKIDQNDPTSGTNLATNDDLLTESEMIQKYLHLMDQVAAKQSNFQSQLGQYRNRLAKLQISSLKDNKHDNKARPFFFWNTPTNAIEPAKTIKEADSWLNSAWKELERENRALLDESRNLINLLKQ